MAICKPFANVLAVRGHVRKRGATWSYVIDVGRDPVTRKRRQVWKGGYRTRKAAEAALAGAIGAVNAGTHVSPSPETVREWIDRWLVTMQPKIRPSTLRDYRNGLARVSDSLGNVKLQSLRPLDVEEFYASLLQDGHRYGGGLAPKTVRNVHIALRRSLADAERFGLVTRNVAAAVKPPVPERREMQTWTTEDVRQLPRSDP